MSTNTITYSSELMKNFVQAEIMSPQEKFEAVQTSTGCSLLFSIDTNGVFSLTQETPGTVNGWVQTDLSSAQIAKDFAGQTGVTCKTFDVAQNTSDGTIGLAMVINDTKNDYLYLCLENSNSDTSWASQPSWVSYGYDNTVYPEPVLSIENVFISETLTGTTNTQYIIVDISQDPSSAEQLIARYYIDILKTGGYAWQVHNIGIDLEASSYSSCVGRQSGQTIDGIYTIGQVGSLPQFSYQPVFNLWNPAEPAASALFTLPNNLLPESIAACRNSDQSTDLYVMADGGLYYFASNAQKSGAIGVLLFQNNFFTGTTYLCAYSGQGEIFIWGLNQADQVFYTSCPIGQVTNASAWKPPVPILTGVDLISPYINLVNNGNTFFAVGGNELYKMEQSPLTSIWTEQSVTLPAPASTSPPQAFSSYTTRIQYADQNNLAIPQSPLMISANTRGTFFINNLYYVLDSTPIPVNTDAMGSITIIESVSDLQGTQLTIAEGGGSSVQINPMDTPFNKVAQLNSVSSLQSAVITNSDGSTTPLVAPGTSQNDLQTVATGNQNLATAYGSFSSSDKARAFAVLNRPQVPALASFPNAIVTDVGDIFKWLESEVDSVIEVIRDEATGIWNFIATIAGQAYQGVLDCVEKVVGAVQWVFNAIKTAINDLINFLEFLFAWQDILTTHRVMKNVFTQYVQNAIDSLSNYKTDISTVFTTLQTDINAWANIPSFNQTPGGTSASNPTLAGQNSAPAGLAIHHYQSNAANSTSTYVPPSPSEAIFQDLINLLSQEGDTLSGACNAIQTDIIDQFNNLTLTEIMQKFLAIIVDTLLQTVENILLAVIDVFIQLATGMMDLLTVPIEIPVVSWLYTQISGDDLTLLDVVCLVSAIPATIVYKLASGSAPFPAGDPFTTGLLGATSMADIQGLFVTSSLDQSMGSRRALMAGSPVLNQSRLKTFGVVTGFCALGGSLVLIYTSTVQNLLDVLTGQVNGTLTFVTAVANIAYVSPNIATFINMTSDNWYQQMNNVLTGISLVKGFVDMPLSTATNPLVKAISPGVETVINLLWNIPVIANIVENYDDWDSTYKSLIPESAGNFAFNFGGMMALPIALTEDLKAKAIMLAVQDGLMLTYGLFMPIAGGIYQWAPNQQH